MGNRTVLRSKGPPLSPSVELWLLAEALPLECHREQDSVTVKEAAAFPPSVDSKLPV